MRLIVVDDDRLVVDSLKIILGAQPQIEVVGTGANGDEAVALYSEHAPDIALLDIQMPGRDGLSAAHEILERDPTARVVFLTTFSDDEYIVSALKLGARGYLIKTDVAAIPRRWHRSWMANACSRAKRSRISILMGRAPKPTRPAGPQPLPA